MGVIRIPHLAASFASPALLAVLGSGLPGSFFSRLLQTSLIAQPGRIGRWRRRHPVAFAALCGLAIAVIGRVSGGSTFGSGYESTIANAQILELRANG